MRYIYFITAILLGSTAQAQIPNNNFENWIETIFYPFPENWNTTNTEISISVDKDEDAYEGEFAMRVEALPMGVGSEGRAWTTVPIDYIPASLDFYAKAFNEFGATEVRITFYNDTEEFSTHSTVITETLEEWTFVSIPLVQNEPVLTHAVIEVSAYVGDLVPGEAWISVDQMGFGGTVSVSDSYRESIIVYPNPTCDFANIDDPKGDVKRVRVFNPAGTEIHQQTVLPGIKQVDLKSVPAGVYILKLELTDGRNIIKRIIVSH